MPTQKLSEIKGEIIHRISCGVIDLDRIIGHTDIGNRRYFGFPIGKITCLSGEHGIGKSRLCIQLCKNMNRRGLVVLYFQGEVPLPQFKTWFGNVFSQNNIIAGDDTKPNDIIKEIRFNRPSFVVVDSMNMIDGFMTINANNNQFFTELRTVLRECKAHCMLIGQLTKDGKTKGPSHVPHMVDIECRLTSIENCQFLANRTWNRITKKKWISNIKACIGDGCFIWEVGKNRCGRTGGWVMFYHTESGIKFGMNGDVCMAKLAENGKKTEQGQSLEVPEKGLFERFIDWLGR